MIHSIMRALTLGTVAAALLTAAPSGIHGQDRGTDREMHDNLGYGLEPGQAIIIIVPEDIDPGDRTRRTAVEVTKPPSDPVSVGNCHREELPLQAGSFFEREEGADPISVQLGVLYPDDVELAPGTVIGAWRPSSPCGPGFQILRGHILDTEY